MKRSFKTIIFLFIFLLSMPGFLLAGQHRLIRVVDGDPIIVNYRGKPEKICLPCVNTHESVHPDKKQNIPIGKTASDYTQEKLARKCVNLEFERKLRDK